MEHAPRIIVVDDEEDSLELVTRKVSAAGFKSEGLRDAGSCLALVEGGLPDLILLDVTMPGVSGLDLLRQLRSKWSKQELPVILVTSLHEADDVVSGLDAGANDYIVKPVGDPKVLRARMAVCLDIGRASRERDEARLQLQAALESMEQRVQLRTSELDAANRTLRDEVAERTRAEQNLLAYQGQLRSLASRLAVAEEQERKRIAAGLHDDVGQLLALMRIKLGSDEVSPRELIGFLDQAIRFTRSLTFELGSGVIFEFGLEAALESAVEEFRKRHGIACVFEDDEQPKPLDIPARLAMYRVVRELLHNIVKHARATAVTVSIWRQYHSVCISVTDNGVGFEMRIGGPEPTAQGGFGLFHAQERLSAVAGSVEICSRPGVGTNVTLTVPAGTEPADSPPGAGAPMTDV